MDLQWSGSQAVAEIQSPYIRVCPTVGRGSVQQTFIHHAGARCINAKMLCAAAHNMYAQVATDVRRDVISPLEKLSLPE